MRFKYYIIFIFFTIITLSQNIIKCDNIEYGNDLKHKLDVYMSGEFCDLPVIVYIHGGFWRDGDKKTVEHKQNLFIKNGYILVSINYRLSPYPNRVNDYDRVMFPDHVNDVALALRWVYDNIHEFGGNNQKITLMGFSAGAQLAALVSLNDVYLNDVGLNRSIIKSVICIDGSAYDIPTYLKSYINEGDITYKTYLNAFGYSSNFEYASPITHLKPNIYLPKFLLIHSNINSRKYISKNFGNRIQMVGGNVVYLNTNSWGHGQMDVYIGHPDKYNYSNKILKFLRNE